MRTLGYIKDRCLIHLTYWITLVLFIVLNALRLPEFIWEESIFGLLENQRVSLEKLNRKVIGKSIMDPVQN